MSHPESNVDETPAPEGPEAGSGESPDASPATRRRDPRFRAKLIEKLPKLGYSSWSAKEDFKVDEEWSGIVSLRSDAVLEPLEPLAPKASR
jgi:hypothetical protein